jgi:small subunit ribosomal protein S16
MAVKIRLTRLGSKKNAHYRVVVIDSHSPRDGKSIETIGRYVPQADPSVVEIDTERARAWLAKGAQPSEPVKKLLRIAGVGDPRARRVPGSTPSLQTGGCRR